MTGHCIRLRSVWCALAAVCACAASSAAAAPSYAVVDLGSLVSSPSASTGFSINNLGQVAGLSYVSNDYFHAFLATSGQMIDLGTLGGNYSVGYGINNSGQVVGFASTTGGEHIRAFVYSGGTMTDIGALGTGLNSGAWAINDVGQVAGDASFDDNGAGHHAFLYTNAVMHDLGTLGGSLSFGRAINASGDVAGASETYAGLTHAFLYHNGTMNDLGTLGGTFSYGVGMNDLGQVIGYSSTDQDIDSRHAFLYQAGTMLDLGTVAGGGASFALGINNAGDVVGTASVGEVAHGFLYTQGHMIDLNMALDGLDAGGWIIYSAFDINDHGVIVAEGHRAGGYHAVLLVPVAVPEPSTQTLLACALGAMVFAGFRRRRRSTR